MDVKTSVLPDEYQTDVIVVGAGIAGASIAAALGSDGRKVVVFDRDMGEPDRIVGELLQPGGLRALKKLGLIDCVEGIDSPRINGYYVFDENDSVALPYPTQDYKACEGRSFHHGRFVQRIRHEADSHDNVQLVEAIVTNLNKADDGTIEGVMYKDKEGNKKTISASLTVICDGIHSKFRDEFVGPKPASKSSFCGVVLPIDALPHRGHGHVFLGSPGPILGYPISSTEVRILIDLPNPMPSQSKGDLHRFLREVTAPQLPQCTQDRLIALLDSGHKIRSMACSCLHPNPGKALKRGAVLLGDAWNVRNPLTGGGMTVAFSDAVILRRILRKIPDLSDHEKVTASIQRNFHRRRHKLASTINVLAEALHSLAAPGDQAMTDMRAAYFGYLKLGGIAVTGPMSLLSGVMPAPALLISHFFAVALFGIGRILLPLPTPAKIVRSFKLLFSATRIVTPLMFHEHMLSVR